MIPKISILIPTYNGSKSIKRALDSAVGQTYRNIEIVCVDDCSTDGVGKIIKQYMKKDDRIKLVRNKINNGLSNVRNILIKNSVGEYFTFLDDDDRLDLQICEIFVKKLNGSDKKCDIAPFKSVVYLQATGLIPFINICSNNLKTKITGPQYLEKNLSVCWGCFINRKFYSSLKVGFCPYARRFEDLGFMPYVILNCKTFLPIKKVGYYYYKKTTGKLSSLRGDNLDILKDMLLQTDYLLSLCQKKGLLKNEENVKAIFSAVSIGAGAFIAKYKVKSPKKASKLLKEKIKYEYMQLVHIKYGIPLDLFHDSWWKKFEALLQTFFYWRQTKSIKQVKK